MILYNNWWTLRLMLKLIDFTVYWIHTDLLSMSTVQLTKEATH